MNVTLPGMVTLERLVQTEKALCWEWLRRYPRTGYRRFFFLLLFYPVVTSVYSCVGSGSSGCIPILERIASPIIETGKGIASYLNTDSLEGYAGKTVASLKSAVSYGCNAVRNGYAGKTGAISKSAVPYGYNAVADGYADKTVAVRKCNAVADGYV